MPPSPSELPPAGSTAAPAPRKVIPSPRSFGSSPYIVSDQPVARALPAAIDVPTAPVQTPVDAVEQGNAQAIPIARSGMPTDNPSGYQPGPAPSTATSESIPSTPPRVIAKSVPVAPGTVAASLPVTSMRTAGTQPVSAPMHPIAAVHPGEPVATTSSPTAAAAPTNASLAAAAAPVNAAPSASERFVLVQNAPSQRFITPPSAAVAEKKPDLPPPPTGGAEVVTYNVGSYIVLEGDSFDRIARDMYRTEGYGAALAHYNRSKLPSDQLLASGSRILLPPSDVLRREAQRLAQSPASPKLAEAARPASPVEIPTFETTGTGSPQPTLPAENTAQTNSNFPEVIPAGKPVETNLTMPSEPISTSAGKVTDAADGPVYKVEKQETLYAIARRTLGDGRRWREIYDLNTDRLRSEYEIPIGISLRLPAEARR
jgi:LysM repeat protein